MSVTINGKKVTGIKGFLVALFTLVYLFFVVGVVLSIVFAIIFSPLWIPILIGVLIGKAF